MQDEGLRHVILKYIVLREYVTRKDGYYCISYIVVTHKVNYKKTRYFSNAWKNDNEL